MKSFLNSHFYFKIMLVLYSFILYGIITKNPNTANFSILFTSIFIIVYIIECVKEEKEQKDFFKKNEDLGSFIIDEASYKTCLESLTKACSYKINGDELIKKYKDKYDCNKAYYSFSSFIFTLLCLITGVFLFISFYNFPISSIILGTIFICVFIPISCVLMISFEDYDSIKRFAIYWEIKNSLSDIPIVKPKNLCVKKCSNKTPVKVRLKRVEAS